MKRRLSAAKGKIMSSRGHFNKNLYDELKIFARKIAYCPDDAEDILHDVWSKREQFEKHPNLTAAMKRAIINRNIDYARKRRRKPLALVLNECLNAIRSKNKSPLEEAILREICHRMQKAIRTLDYNERAVVNMKYVQDLKTKEIARITGLSQQQVRHFLTVIKGKLEEQLR